MNNFNKIFFQGLIAVLPIAVTIYVISATVQILDSLLGSILKLAIPRYADIPGVGFVLILILIYTFGLLLNSFVASRLISAFEKKLTEVPFIKAIYSPLRDLMNLFSKSGHNHLGSVVLVKIGESEAKMLGLVTRDNFDDIKIEPQTHGKIAVYFPLSYGVGGLTVLVPREQVEEIDVPVEKAMSLAITGWVKADTVKK